MTTTFHTTRRTVITALPVAAVLPAAAEPDNPMERVVQHARAIRDILRDLGDDRRVTIYPASNQIDFDDVS